MSLAAKEGKLDVAKLPPKNRRLHDPRAEVTRANVDQVVNDFMKNTPKYDLSNFWRRW